MDTMILQTDDFTVFESGVCGTFYLMIGQTPFPEDEWFDMIAVNLKQWIPRITSFTLGHSDQCCLEFMDAPCVAKLTRDPSGTHVQGYWNGKEIIEKREFDFNAFLGSVIEAVDRYHHFVQIKHFSKELKILLNCFDLGENHV